MSAAQNRNSSQSSGRRRISAAEAKRRKAIRRRKVIIRRIAAVAVLAAIIIGAIILITSLAGVKNVKDLEITASGTTQILSWTGNEKYSYEVYRLIPGTKDEYELTAETEKGAMSAAVDGGSEVTLNTYKVVSVKGNSRSKGRIISGYTAPLAPSDVAAKTVSADSVNLTWKASDAATGFNILYSENENMSGAQKTSISSAEAGNAGSFAYTLTGLSSNTDYYFQVQSFADITEKGYEGQYLSDPAQTVNAKVWRSIAMDGIDVNAPMIALTFDDGPDIGADITNQILDVFERYGCYATFFQLGDRAEMEPDVMKRIVAGGHEIGCHTYDHEHYGEEVTEADIIDADDAIEEACGVRPTAFRSPGGMTTDLIKAVCAAEDMPIYNWSVDSRDWEIREADSVIYLVENYAYDGGIALMHNIYYSTAEAVEVLVPRLLEEGYQLVTLSQLIQAKTGEPPIAGMEYYDYETVF